MKIIDRNGRLFGKISVIDVIVILAVIVMAAAIYVKTHKPQTGSNVEIDLMENTSDARDSGDFDFIGGGWQTVNNADGQSYLKNRWSDGGPDNYTAFHSDAFQEVMERLDTAFDYEDRVQCFVDAENVLTEECPTLFLYANENITLINTDKVKDVTVFPIDYYMLTSKWTAAE